MPPLTSAADGRTVGPDPRTEIPAELLDVRAVASLLGGCSTRHIFRMADSGQMPRPVRLGNLVRWRKAEVLDWISAGCPQSHPTKAAPK